MKEVIKRRVHRKTKRHVGSMKTRGLKLFKFSRRKINTGLILFKKHLLDLNMSIYNLENNENKNEKTKKELEIFLILRNAMLDTMNNEEKNNK